MLRAPPQDFPPFRFTFRPTRPACTAHPFHLLHPQDESERVLEEHKEAWKEEEQHQLAKRAAVHAKATAKARGAGQPAPPPLPTGPVRVHFADVLYRQFKTPMIAAGVIKGFNDVAQFAWPLILLQYLGEFIICRPRPLLLTKVAFHASTPPHAHTSSSTLPRCTAPPSSLYTLQSSLRITAQTSRPTRTPALLVVGCCAYCCWCS